MNTDAAVRDTYVRHVENQTTWLKEICREVSMQSTVTLSYLDALRTRISITADALNARSPYISDEIDNPESYDEFKDVPLSELEVVFGNWIKYKLLQKSFSTIQSTINSLEKAVDRIDNLNRSLLFTNKGEIPNEKPISRSKSIDLLIDIENAVSQEVDPAGLMCDPTQRSESLVRDYFCALVAEILRSSLRPVDITDKLLSALEEENRHKLYWACQTILGQCSIAYCIDLYAINKTTTLLG